MSKPSTSSGRNLANIPQLKKEFKVFGDKQKASPEVMSWLGKTFLRWVINDFPHITTVTTESEFTALTGDSAPDWFVEKIGQVEFIHIDPNHPYLSELLTRCTEWLSRHSSPKLIKKFPKMTVPHVLKKWRSEHDRLKRSPELGLTTTGNALKEVFRFNEFRVVEFIPDHSEFRPELTIESWHMQHCIGQFQDKQAFTGGYGEHYAEQAAAGVLRFFSLRDEKNKPHATLSFFSNEEGELSVEQVKGKQNRSPIERYIPACHAFLNAFNVGHQLHSDCLAMGLTYQDGRTISLEEADHDLQKQLVAHHPNFIFRIAEPSEALLWLVATRAPTLIPHLPQASREMKIAALIQDNKLMKHITFDDGLQSKALLSGFQRYCIEGRLFKFLKLTPKRV